MSHSWFKTTLIKKRSHGSQSRPQAATGVTEAFGDYCCSIILGHVDLTSRAKLNRNMNNYFNMTKLKK